MSVLTTIPNGASNRDIRDTINALLNRVSVLEAAGTPAPTPAPAFASQPSISPGNGTAGSTTFAATPGAVTNGSVVSRAWLLNGTAISTGLTATPQQSGTLTYQETASGPGGTTTSAVQAAGVAAATVTPTPSPSFTAQPSISPSTGTAGATTFTATPGTVSNGSISSRAWAINGTVISTGLTASPASSGTLTYQETATGPGGTTQSTVLQVAVGSAAAAAPAFTAQPSVSPGNGTANSTTFTATPGTVSNGSITSRSWSLNGSVISTALTAAPTAAGTLTYQETATGSGGTTQSTAQTVTVSAAAASTSLTIAWAGSSTYEKGGTDGSGPTVADATRSTDGVTFTPIGTQGAALLTYAAIMKKRTGLPVKYLLEGHGGSTVAGWLSQGSGDRKGLVDAIKAAGGCDLLNWACGFNDALQNIVVSEAQHLANLRALFALIRSETGLPNLKITVGVSQPYRGTASAGPDSVWTAVRSAEMTVAQDANNYFSSHWFDLPQGGDGIHLTGEGMTALYTRVAENGLAALGLGGAVAETGPRIIAAQALYSTKTRLTLAHSRGSDFTPTSALSGFLVSFDNGATFVTPTAAARVDATHIDLTHAASGGAAPTIWAFPGKSPVTTAVLHDNSPRALPLNPTYSAGIKAAAGSSAAEPGAPVDTTAPVITSAATASQPESAAFSLTLTANEAVTWSKVGGADAAKFTLSGATLTLPAQDYEVPTDADANRTYIVTVRATDTAGNAADQTITVTITDVAEGGTSTGKTAKVAFSKANIAPTGFNAFFGDVSQTQNANAGRTKALLDTAGAATGWTVTTTNFNGGNDTQGTTTGANTGAYPDAAMLGYWYNGVAANGDNGGVATPSTTLAVSGLNPAKKYTFKAFGARAAADRKTTYTAGGTSQTIDCGQNTSLVATFASLTPDSSGVLTLTFAPAAANGYGYLNVLEIVEG